MDISKKKPPKPRDLDGLSRSVYDDINHLIDAVNAFKKGASREAEGKEGDLKVTTDGKDVSVEVRTDKGWSRSIPGLFDPDGLHDIKVRTFNVSDGIITIDDLPDSPEGLPVGRLYRDGDTIKVVI